jgi:two-component system phosphate regulon sensor histidine kinase PhoR
MLGRIMSDAGLTVQLINALPDGAIVIDGSATVLAANSLAEDALNLRLAGLNVSAVIRNASFIDALATVLADGAAQSVDIEVRGKPPRQLSAHISPMKGSGWVLILLRDLTREQAIEKMRSDFVANASHEMRTPLASIMGTIETLQGAAKNDAKARDMFLETMMGQARRMKRLIDDLLTLSRIELNEHVRPNAKVSLVDVARQAKSNLSSLAQEAGIVVEITSPGNVSVAGDAEELLQVVQNLLENAIKYGGSGGRVEITCEQTGRHGTLSVRDFGKGIAEVHIPRLTERFYRVNTQESRQRGGTGLGLAIVKHIMLRHRGRLDIDSGMGQGSTFSVSIPLYNS